jgi:hypothetical protein
MSREEIQSIMERKRKLEEQLNNKISAEWKDLVNKSEEYMQQMRESNRQYWKQQINRELDDMEKAMKSGDIVGAMSHRIAADNYSRFLDSL